MALARDGSRSTARRLPADDTDGLGSGDAMAGADHGLLDEQRFLLRSLQDLDEELAAGDIDDADYELLRSRYTARAAAVLRALQGGAGPAPPAPPAPTPSDAGSPAVGGGRQASAPAAATSGAASAGPAGGIAGVVVPAGESSVGPAGTTGVVAPAGESSAGGLRRWLRSGTPARRRRRRRALVGGAVSCFVVAALVLVTGALGVGLPGDPLTGSLTLTTSQRVQRLLAQGEEALLESHSAQALDAFEQVLALDPRQVEALSEAGWLEYAAGVRAKNRTLVSRGQAHEDTAVKQAPGQFGPRFYLAAMLAQEGQVQPAVTQFEAGLGDKPPATTVAVFASTIDEVFGQAHVPVPSSVAADVAAVQAEARAASSGSGG